MNLHNIAILLRLQFGYDCDLAKGVARYAHTRPHWRLFVWPKSESRFNVPPDWHCHGAIALLDEPNLEVVGDVPVVYIGTGGEAGACVVGPDERMIGRLAAEHLHAGGFHRLTCYSGAKPWAMSREEGFRQAAEAMGCQYVPCPFTYSHRMDVDWTDAASTLASWLTTVPCPLGLMGVNDNAARVASEACHVAGLHVPEQVGIVGVDNDQTLCELSSTPLSSIDPATDRIGYVAAQTLDRWLTTGEKPASPIVVAPRGVVRRRSTDVVAFGDDAVAAAVRYLRDHFYESISVDDVAEAACLSRSALHRRFKSHVGRSVQQEITRLRVQQACELLRHGDDRLDHVAAASGFENLAYFHKVFKRHTGHTPGTYRRSDRTATR